MKVADIFEARALNRDWVRDADMIMHDDKRDVMQRVSMEEAQKLVPLFIDRYGHPEWSEEDNGGIGLWQYNWEQWITNPEGEYQRWFIKIGWYVPSKTGLIQVTRHRKYQDKGKWDLDKLDDLKEAKTLGMAGDVECPHCHGKGWYYETHQYGEDDFDVSKEFCHVCDTKGVISKKEYLKRGYHLSYEERVKRARAQFRGEITEASHVGNPFAGKLRRAIADVQNEPFNYDSFDVDLSYQDTQVALEKLLGPPQWQSMDYGDDVPFWLLENDTIYLTVEKVARQDKGWKFKTEIILEYDPNGWKV